MVDAHITSCQAYGPLMMRRLLTLHLCASAGSTTFRAGVLVPYSQKTQDGYASHRLAGVEVLLAVRLATKEINNKTDSVSDTLLPSTEVLEHNRD
jgi:hypothetical protein